MRPKILPVYPPSSPQTTPTSGIKGSPKSPDSGKSSLVATVCTNSLSQSNDLCATNDWSVRTNHSYAARPSTPKTLYKEGTVVKDILSNIKLNIKEEIGSHKPMPEKLKDKENRYPLYPVGPPLSMTGHWYNLMQSELKYSGFFYEDCPGQFQRRNNADSSDENEALFNPFGP